MPMNLFGNSAADGSHALLRRVAFAGIAIVAAATAMAHFTEKAARDGSLAFLPPGIFFSNGPDTTLARLPRPSEQNTGVRYGNVDYMATASIPASKQRVKNVVSDPSLGMPN